jgi:hypothetical protein
VGPPSDPDRECSGRGTVGVVVQTKAYERTEFRGSERYLDPLVDFGGR